MKLPLNKKNEARQWMKRLQLWERIKLGLSHFCLKTNLSLVANGYIRLSIMLMVLYRYKARLMAKCYTQLEGLDFIDTFYLVAKLTNIRHVLSLTIIHN